MKNRRGISGFTMAEMLIVVAIIAVLGGVGFVAVQNYQRSMAQLECDAIAKEIFVAAQNHLTMADSQGYLGITSYGTSVTIDEDTDIFGRKQVYYYTVNGNIPDDTLLSLMLPFGSIDETVRMGGSYIIRYQPKPARVLDVFYCSATDPRFSHTLEESEYNTLLGIRDTYNADGTIKDNNKNDRKKYGNAVVGWFGGEDVLITGNYDIIAPEISVENAERLTVIVTDKNYEKSGSGAVLKLLVTSKDEHDSGYAKAAFLLAPSSHSERVSDDNGKYTIVLDDITTERAHFAELNDIMETTVNITGKFIPGEDIIVQAVAYNKDFLSNIAYSNSWTVNSLFAEISQKTPEQLYSNASVIPGADAPWITAIINNFRHLENLDAAISNTGLSDLAYAWQINDLVWNGTEGFTGKIQKATNVSAVSVYNADNTERSTDDCFAPVIPPVMNESLEPIAFTYDGREIKQINGNGAETETISHSITGLKVNTAGNAGLFGNYGLSEAGQSNIAYLELVDFEITSTGGNAGALAGTLNHTTVSNVLAYHKNDSATITATDGDAGGLVGAMNGGQIKQCAAALYVQGKANAGGLVGKAENATITASYSGGHTKEGSYSDNIETNKATEKGLVNVIGGTNAGGLIGAATGNTSIQYCYSTCSASGTTAAGGLIGSVDNATGKTVTVNYCYAAGLVKSDAHAGTFLGQPDPEHPKELATGSANNHYVSGINGTMESGCNATALPGVVKNAETELCKPAIDADNLTKDKRKYASPYDRTIIAKKGAELHPRYTYLTIQQICDVSKPDSKDEPVPDFISMHYGDWQEPVVLKTGLELINAEKLTAKLTLPVEELDEGQMLTMMLKGKTSDKFAYLLMSLDKNTTGGKATYDVALKATSSIEGIDKIMGWLDNIIVKDADIGTNKSFEFGINLDSITDEGCHFAQLFPAFIPGEDIIVAIRGNEVSAFEMQAVIAATPLKKETNSLFAETSIEADKTTASIGNFRHLENLDRSVSNVAVDTLSLQNAIQTEDLVWENFCKTINAVTPSNVKVYYAEEATDAEGNITTTIQSTVGGCFKPVAVSYALNYNGQSTNADETTTIHSITGVKVDCTGDAGLFGSMVDGSSISNLELIDFSVTGTGNAGTLAGTLARTNVTNVLAHNRTSATTTNITATGNAGGLIGSMDGGTIEKCAAALIVNAGDDTHVGNAGGLIGTVSNGTMVSASYSGGHATKTVKTVKNDEERIIGVKYESYNVTAATGGTAGGLIGAAGNSEIKNSYSTCSATGGIVGGFIGTAINATKVDNCYATGLVSGTSEEGAFAGTLANDTEITAPCQFYEIINERFDKEELYLKAVGSGSSTNITALDHNAETYDSFVGNPDKWGSAKVYNEGLSALFGENNYSLKTVAQLLGITTINNNFVAMHYGDWPAPEMLVVNED